VCVLVRATNTETPAWCRQDVAIHIPSDATPSQALASVRLILRELGAPQPPDPARAVCFCGDDIGLAPWQRSVTLASRPVPTQRGGSVMEASHGA
jgi:hypothetical protein